MLNGTLFCFVDIVSSHKFCMSSLSHLSASHNLAVLPLHLLLCVNKDAQNLSSAVFVCASVWVSGTDCVCVYIHSSCQSSCKFNWSYPSIICNGVIFLDDLLALGFKCAIARLGVLLCQNCLFSRVFWTFVQWSNLTMLSCDWLELKAAGLSWVLQTLNLVSKRLLYFNKNIE